MLEIVCVVCLNIWESTSKKVSMWLFPNLIPDYSKGPIFFFLRKLIFESHFHQAQTFRFLPAQLWILNDWQNLGKFRKLWPWSEGTNSEIRSLRQTPPLCTSNHPAHPPPNDTTALENLLIHNTPHLHLRELVIRTTTSCRSSQKNLNIEVILCVWTNQSHTSAEGSFSFPGF